MRKIDESKAANKRVGGNSLTHKTSKSRLDEVKLAKLSTTNKMLDDKYGTHGTETRNEFDEQSLAWFYGNMLKERRKELKLTQKEVAEKLGRDQSYIARVERGKADIQLSSFFRIASILGIQFAPSFV